MPFVDPSRFTAPLRRFARNLGSHAEPQVVQPLALPESQSSPQQAVARAVTSLGGEAVSGWRLQEWKGIALSASQALVWRDTEGRLWNLQDEGYWLFVVDGALRQARPRYQALRRDALVEDFIRVGEQQVRCTSGSEAAQVLAQTAERLAGWLELGGKGDAPCPCQSGRRYAACCSPRLRESLQSAA